MGLRSLVILDSFSAGIVYRRQILTFGSPHCNKLVRIKEQIPATFIFHSLQECFTRTARGSTLVADVCRRQILTTKVNPRTVGINIFLMAGNPQHRYSNESERVNEDIYKDFKLKITLCSRHFFTNKFSALRVKVCLKLVHRLRRWPNIKSSLGELYVLVRTLKCSQ